MIKIYKDIKKLYEDVCTENKVSLDIMPFTVVSVLESYHTPTIGRFLLQIKREGVTFDGVRLNPLRVTKLEDIVKFMQDSESEGEKIIWTVRLIGAFNKAAREGSNKIIETLLPEEVF